MMNDLSRDHASLAHHIATQLSQLQQRFVTASLKEKILQASDDLSSSKPVGITTPSAFLSAAGYGVRNVSAAGMIGAGSLLDPIVESPSGDDPSHASTAALRSAMTSAALQSSVMQTPLLTGTMTDFRRDDSADSFSALGLGAISASFGGTKSGSFDEHDFDALIDDSLSTFSLDYDLLDDASLFGAAGLLSPPSTRHMQASAASSSASSSVRGSGLPPSSTHRQYYDTSPPSMDAYGAPAPRRSMYDQQHAGFYGGGMSSPYFDYMTGQWQHAPVMYGGMSGGMAQPIQAHGFPPVSSAGEAGEYQQFGDGYGMAAQSMASYGPPGAGYGFAAPPEKKKRQRKKKVSAESKEDEKMDVAEIPAKLTSKSADDGEHKTKRKHRSRNRSRGKKRREQKERSTARRAAELTAAGIVPY
jgi:hypothetical protein